MSSSTFGSARAATLVALAVLIVSLLIGWFTPGYEGDMNQNKSWARTLVRNGMHDAYRANIDYPPVPLYVFAASGWVYQTFVDHSFNERAALNSQTFTFLMKIPVIVCHALLAGVITLLAVGGEHRLGVMAGLAYGLNPATLYDMAHFGQTDSLIGLGVVAAAAAICAGRGLWLGLSAGILVLAKPQAWALMPLFGLGGLVRLSRRQQIMCVIAAFIAMAVILLPWIMTGRLHHAARFLENLNEHALSNRVISADAHNLWWIPTLRNWEWIEDSAPLLGPLSYRAVATVLSLAWLGFCAWAYLKSRAALYVVAAATTFGFFMLMVRAHENHGYLALPLLAAALAKRRDSRILWIFVLASVALLMNLVLRDPLVMGPHTSVPDAGQYAPGWVVDAQILNVVLNLAILLGFAWVLLRHGRESVVRA